MPPEYKPPKMCLKKFICPGLMFGILRYFELKSVFDGSTSVHGKNKNPKDFLNYIFNSE